MAVAILLGLLLGPVLNLLIDRLPRRLPLLALPACLACGASRQGWMLLPLFGWLLSRGRCQHCATALPRRTLVVELALPMIGGALWLRDGSSALFLLQLLLAAYFVAIVAIDLEHRLVLNRLTGMGFLAALTIATVGLGPSLPSAMAGALIGFLFLWIPSLVLPGLGMGDVKLAGVIGALVGVPAVVDALALGVVAGGLAAAFLLLTSRVGRRGTIAYAPYLIIGVTLVLFGVVERGGS